MKFGLLVSLSNVSVSPAHDPGDVGVGWWFPRFKRTTASVRAVVACDANTGAPCRAALCPFTARASTPSSDFQPVAGSFYLGPNKQQFTSLNAWNSRVIPTQIALSQFTQIQR